MDTKNLVIAAPRAPGHGHRLFVRRADSGSVGSRRDPSASVAKARLFFPKQKGRAALLRAEHTLVIHVIRVFALPVQMWSRLAIARSDRAPSDVART